MAVGTWKQNVQIWCWKIVRKLLLYIKSDSRLIFVSLVLFLDSHYLRINKHSVLFLYICSVCHTVTVNVFYPGHTPDDSERFISCVKKNQIDAQRITCVFRRHLRVSGISRPIIRKYTIWIQQLVLILFRWCSVILFQSIQDNRQSSKKNNKYESLYT